MTASHKEQSTTGIMPETFAEIAEKSSRMLADAMKRHASLGHYSMGDEMGIAKAFFDLSAKMMTDPFKLAEVQLNLWKDYMSLWQGSMLKLMGQQPTDMASDPVYQQATNAYGAQQQRATERERNAIAERMAASGQANSGAMDSRLLGAEQQRGENEASFAGNLAVREMERQRDEIMQALELGAGIMAAEDRLALTEKLGMINASLQQQSITNQANQFDSSLGWEMAQYPSQQNYLAWLMAQ